MSIAQKGRKLSEESKKKMSKAKKGHKAWNKGIPWSEEHKKKMSGKNHHNWQGGKSFELYGVAFNKQLKEQIRKRDSFRCQQCFRHEDELFTKKGKKRELICHHIDYCKQNNNPNNLIALCLNCHMQTNFNRLDWTKYFKKKIL